jgi:multiple antibiotic resistance protein
MDYVQPFIEAFLPLFVAINVLSVLPLFIALTDGMQPGARRRLGVKAIVTAFVIALVILLTGRIIFQALGITVDDLRIGGGLILLVLSITDLLFSDTTRRAPSDGGTQEDLGVVPLGTPLVVGPAAITAILVLQESYGYALTLSSLVANLLLVLLAFMFAPTLIAWIGAGAAKAIGKVASLFLAAISVALIRTGVAGLLPHMSG